jgi:glycosyltransferase involved in cell wall biosynthesis
VYLYCRLTGAHYVVDAHSAAFLYAAWRRPEFVYRHLARKALATIVTNEHFQSLIRHWGARAFVLRDIPTVFSTQGQYSLSGRFNIVVVSSFSEDEPLPDILTAAKQLPQVHFYISGDKQSAPRELLESAPANVHFTGFLPNERYYSLLSAAQAIMSLTTRDNTMQRGACEALSIGKPVIVSDWLLLREYFSAGAVHVQNTETGILEGVMTLQSQYDRYLSEITQLRASRQREWQEKKLALTRLIETTTL